MRTALLLFIQCLVIAQVCFEQSYGAECLLGNLVETCTSSLRNLQQRFENDVHNLRLSFDIKIDELQKKVESRDRQIEELRANVSSLAFEFPNQVARIMNLEDTVDIQSSNINSLQEVFTQAEQDFSSSLDNLETKISIINSTVTTLNADFPLGHVVGDETKGEFDSVAANWQLSSSSEFAPITKGGMTFNGTSFRVPENGIYYMYGLVTILDDSKFCGFSIKVNDNTYLDTSERGEGMGENVVFGSQARRIEAEGIVTMFIKTCRYNFDPVKSYFGIFLLQRE
ncbi:uncharacterized protein LOC134176109 [Corticium candelabrum]|uniref:uncharacterized protein LOC134176109 n=1 Tax=Corticium candelabrum TaxID=121492 RepID=UPI002E25F5F4|nr:uncharacterized protein LOC134176109 [Corticium candelabrum]